jgi:hypothetical protein
MKKFSKEVGIFLIQEYLKKPVEGKTISFENYVNGIALIDSLPEEALYFIALPEEEGDLYICWNGQDQESFCAILLFDGNMMQLLIQDRKASLDECSEELLFDIKNENLLRLIDRVVAEG